MLLNAMGTNKTGTEKVSIGKVPGDISKSNSRGDGVEGKGVGRGAVLLGAEY